jgi:hypothetical protein
MQSTPAVPRVEEAVPVLQAPREVVVAAAAAVGVVLLLLPLLVVVVVVVVVVEVGNRRHHRSNRHHYRLNPHATPPSRSDNSNSSPRSRHTRRRPVRP